MCNLHSIWGYAKLERNLIDNEFDAEFANQLAEHESYNKHLYRPNTYLHKWWARRCGTTFRAILKHLVRDPSKLDYYSPGGLEGQIILDPMMGGGTTVHEAIRMGANVVGADLDPIPLLQVRATLSEVPPKTMDQAFATLHETLRVRSGHLYSVTCPVCAASYETRFVLYGVRRRCGCQDVVMVDSYVLRHNTDGSVVRICPDTYNLLVDDRVVSAARLGYAFPLLEKGVETCECGEKYVEDTTLPFYRRYLPVAVVGECQQHGVFFAAPGQSEVDAAAFADARRDTLGFRREDFVVNSGPKSADLLRRGVDNYLDLFSSRQLLYLRHATEELRQFEPAVRLKLAMLVSTSVEFNSMLCGYKGAARNRPGAVRHTFAHHAYSFPYTALENNPLSSDRSSGTLVNLYQSRLVRGREWAMKPIERRFANGKIVNVPIVGEVDFGTEYQRFDEMRDGSQRFLLLRGSSAHLDLPDDSIDHVVTDPPYFDSVQYSDLAAFFRVWLRQLLPEDMAWEYSLGESAVDQQVNGSDLQYLTVLGEIFAECHRVLKKEHGRLIFTFHHWNPKGWAALTVALKRAGFWSRQPLRYPL